MKVPSSFPVFFFAMNYHWTKIFKNRNQQRKIGKSELGHFSGKNRNDSDKIGMNGRSAIVSTTARLVLWSHWPLCLSCPVWGARWWCHLRGSGHGTAPAEPSAAPSSPTLSAWGDAPRLPHRRPLGLCREIKQESSSQATDYSNCDMVLTLTNWDVNASWSRNFTSKALM